MGGHHEVSHEGEGDERDLQQGGGQGGQELCQRVGGEGYDGGGGLCDCSLVCSSKVYKGKFCVLRESLLKLSVQLG